MCPGLGLLELERQEVKGEPFLGEERKSPRMNPKAALSPLPKTVKVVSGAGEHPYPVARRTLVTGSLPLSS